MRILSALLFLSLTAVSATSSVAQEDGDASTAPKAAGTAEEIVMSATNLDRAEEELRQMENKVLQQLVTGKTNPVSAAPTSAPKVAKAVSVEKKTKEVLEPVEPPAAEDSTETISMVKASSVVREKPIAKAQPETKPVEPETTSTLDSLRSLETHPAIRSKTNSVKGTETKAVTQVDSAASDKLLIAESQVKILSRELETTRQSLRSAERRIDELSDLVQSTYSQGDSAKRDEPILPEFFDGEDAELPRADDGARASLAPRPSLRGQPLPAAWNGATTAEIATISADRAPVRVGPNRNESTIFTLDRFHQVRIELRSGEWYRIITNSGSRGWISGQALTFGNVDSDPNSSVRIRGYNSKYEKAGFQY